jgi:hypothetical protein
LGNFNTLRPANGKVGANEARGFFMQSGLPVEILGKIWYASCLGNNFSFLTFRGLADIDKDGQLIFEEFLIAMYLIDAKLKQNIQTPDSVPLTLIESIKSFSANPTQTQQPTLSTQFQQQQQLQQHLAKRQSPQVQTSPNPTNPYATLQPQLQSKPTTSHVQPSPANTNTLPPTNTNAQQQQQQQQQGFQFFSVDDIEHHKRIFDSLANMTTGFKVAGPQALQFFSQTGTSS